jgi:hypothetical protein
VCDCSNEVTVLAYMESPATIPMRHARLFSEATLELPVAMGVADVIFRPSLLTSQADDIEAAVATMLHDHYSDGSN